MPLIHKPGTDQSLTMTLHANNIPCAEYTLPPHLAPTPTPSILELFVPVPDNATLSLTGAFCGSVLHFRLDVLADGTFVVDRLIEGRADGNLKKWDTRKLEMKSFSHVPDPEMAGRGRKAKVVEGALVARRFPAKEIRQHRFEAEEKGEGTLLGPGSVACVLSLNQVAWDTYGVDSEPAYRSASLGSWRSTPVTELRNSGIPPEHELQLDVFPDSDPVREKKANTFWRSYQSARFGETGPWGTVIFYVRSKQAIEKAGCVRFLGGWELPAQVGIFQTAGEEVVEVKEVKKEEPVVKKRLGIGRELVLPEGFGGGMLKGGGMGEEGGFGELLGRYRGAVEQDARDSRSKTSTPMSSAFERRSTISEQGSVTSVPSSAYVQALGTLDLHAPVDFDFNANDIDNSLFLPPTSPATPTPTVFPKNPVQPLPTTAATPNPSSASFSPLKRPATPTTPSDSPAKRAKAAPSTPSSSSVSGADFSARKAALLASLNAKRERKAVALAKIEEEKAAREEQRRVWEAEMEARKIREAGEEARRVEEQRLREAEEKRLREEEEQRLREEEEEKLREEEQRLRQQEEEEELARLEKEAEKEAREAEEELERLKEERLRVEEEQRPAEEERLREAEEERLRAAEEERLREAEEEEELARLEKEADDEDKEAVKKRTTTTTMESNALRATSWRKLESPNWRDDWPEKDPAMEAVDRSDITMEKLGSPDAAPMLEQFLRNAQAIHPRHKAETRKAIRRVIRYAREARTASEEVQLPKD